MKDQVTGSFTMSLGQLADGMVEHIVQGLAAKLAEKDRPEFYTHEQIVGLMTGFGVPYELADSVARNMAVYGLGVTSVVPGGDAEYRQPEKAAEQPDQPDPQSAEAWFREGL